MANSKLGTGINQQPNGKYQVRWTDQNGKRVSRAGFKHLADARAFQRKVLAAVEQGLPTTEPMWTKVLRQHLGMNDSIELGEFNPRGFFVYLLWQAAMDKPFYVGQSINVLARVGAHMANPDRRHRVDRVTFLRCYAETDMFELEERLIRFYEPELNVLGPGRVKVWRLNGHKMVTEDPIAPSPDTTNQV